LFHAVWATASRRASLEEQFDEELIRIMGQKARDVGCSLLAAGCAPDHVHVVARLASTTTVADLVCRMKGGGAFDARRALGRREIVWQRGYWAESIDVMSLDDVVRYVRSQRTKHDASHPAERWQQATHAAPDARGRNLTGS
jgi:REP element-mobilizing transposase RayT